MVAIVEYNNIFYLFIELTRSGNYNHILLLKNC